MTDDYLDTTVEVTLIVITVMLLVLSAWQTLEHGFACNPDLIDLCPPWLR